MITLLLISCIAFVISFLITPIIISQTLKKNLIHAPGGRRIHTKVTPSFGGIAIFFGVAISSIIWVLEEERYTDLNLLLILAIPLAIGFLDDYLHLNPKKKLLGQWIAASFFVLIWDVKLTSFYGLAGLTVEFPFWISYLVTVFTVTIITNAFNLIDGIDGLAATFAIIALLFFGSWFFLTGGVFYALISFSLIGGISAFLFYNWEPSKIFMGDSGSILIGMVLSVLTIKFIHMNYQIPDSSDVKFDSTIGTSICIIILPLVDTLRVIIIRIRKRLSPFTADKRHIHHTLVRLGNSHRFAVCTLSFLHICFICLAISLRKHGDEVVVSVAVLTAVVLSLFLDRSIQNFVFSEEK